MEGGFNASRLLVWVSIEEGRRSEGFQNFVAEDVSQNMTIRDRKSRDPTDRGSPETGPVISGLGGERAAMVFGP